MFRKAVQAVEETPERNCLRLSRGTGFHELLLTRVPQERLLGLGQAQRVVDGKRPLALLGSNP